MAQMPWAEWGMEPLKPYNTTLYHLCFHDRIYDSFRSSHQNSIPSAAPASYIHITLSRQWRAQTEGNIEIYCSNLTRGCCVASNLCFYLTVSCWPINALMCVGEPVFMHHEGGNSIVSQVLTCVFGPSKRQWWHAAEGANPLGNHGNQFSAGISCWRFPL